MMGNAIFGEPWDAPICEEAVVFPTPIGRKCFWCGEPIVEGDRGMLQGVHKLMGSSFEPIHRECHLRSVVGSWGHLNGTCTCHGGDESDPAHLTARESAIQVWNHLTGDPSS